MGDIQFEDSTEEFGQPPKGTSGSGSDLTDKFVQWGWASSRNQAQKVMLGIILTMIAGTAFVYFIWL